MALFCGQFPIVWQGVNDAKEKVGKSGSRKKQGRVGEMLKRTRRQTKSEKCDGFGFQSAFWNIFLFNQLILRYLRHSFILLTITVY